MSITISPTEARAILFARAANLRAAARASRQPTAAPPPRVVPHADEHSLGRDSALTMNCDLADWPLETWRRRWAGPAGRIRADAGAMVLDYWLDGPAGAALPPAGDFSFLIQGSGSFEGDAPTDGFAYGRQSADWVEVLPLAGGTMGGPLFLAGDPTTPFQAATKQYADKMLPLTGGTLSGALTLAGGPTAALQASTKDYVDTSIPTALLGYLPLTGGTMTGVLTLAADPTAVTQAATKRYVDNAVATSAGALHYRGAWNPTTNTPTLASGGVGGAANDYFVCSVSGTSIAIDGLTTWVATDWIVNKGTAWERVQAATSAYLPLIGGTLSGNLTLSGGDTFGLADPRITSGYPLVYYWRDASANIAGGIRTDGTLQWGAIAAASLSLAGALSAGALTVASLTSAGPISGTAITGTSLQVGGDSWKAWDARIPGYSYGWFDPSNNLAGGITTDGKLSFANATITNLTAVNVSMTNPTFPGGALSLTSLIVGGSTFKTLDARIPGLAWGWFDAAGALGLSITNDGILQAGLANVTASLTLGFDATQPTHALRKSAADAAYLAKTGGAVTGDILLPATPTSNINGAITKGYVDSSVASGGGGGYAGLVAQRDYPTPPLRDPKRDFGAVGDGVADDSAAVNACITAAISAGERMIACNDVFNVPGLSLQAGNTIFVGNGSLKNNVVWKWVTPPFAPSPRAPVAGVNIRTHCPNFCAKLRTTGSAKVVVTGDSVSAPYSNGITSQAVLYTRLVRTLKDANPDFNIVTVNRGIGGGTWQFLDTVHPTAGGAVSWYYDGARPWLDYVHDQAPDLVVINFVANDGYGYHYRDMLSVLAKMATWTPAPEVIFATSTPYTQQSQLDAAHADLTISGSSYTGGYERSYALCHGIGLLDTSRSVFMHRFGFDIEDLPMLRDPAPTGGLVNVRTAPIPLPYTWPTKCFGYGGCFWIPAGSWATLGNEIQFELSDPNPIHGGNRGNVLRVGLDVPSGNIYYQVDTCQIAAGADQDETFIPRTVKADWPGTGNTGIQFSVMGSKLILHASSEQDQYIIALDCSVIRAGSPWTPKITCAAGTVSASGLWWGKEGGGYLSALSAVPHPRAAYWPIFTDKEAGGVTTTPDLPWGGGGQGHASTLFGALTTQTVLDACDFSVL